MFRRDSPVPEVVPQLSRGKHRSPRKGACFMEMASYLAGERWSDHPRCTHRLVGVVARLVNDHTSDRERQRLAELIPSVIGLTTDDPRADVHIALRCATTALPVASAQRQRVLAVSVLAAERALDELDGRPAGTVAASSTASLAHAPEAARWARTFVRGVDTSVDEFREEAQLIIESWRRHYNAVRPHASLGYRAPAPDVFIPDLAARPPAIVGSAPTVMLDLATKPATN